MNFQVLKALIEASYFQPFPSFQDIFTTLCNCCKNTCCSCYRAYHYVHMVWRICIHRVQDAELLFSGLRFHIVFMRICIDAHCTVWPQTSALTWHFNTIVSFFSVICRIISGDRFRGQFMQTQAALDKLLRGTSSLQNISSS